VNWPLVVIAALAGLAVGPVLRMAIDQVPPRRPVLLRRGPDDGPPVRGAHLTPVLSWRVDDAAATTVPVGSPDDAPDGERPTEVRRWRAPAIDLASAAVAASLAARFGAELELLPFLVWGAALVVVTVIDIDHYRIPDRVVFPTLAVCAALFVVVAVAWEIPDALASAALGAIAYFGFLFVFFVVSPAAMGFGDVKLALLLGLHLGWAGAVERTDEVAVAGSVFDALGLTIFGALIGSVLGSLVGVAMLALRGRRAHFPFGPSLCLGALLAVLFSQQLTG
jgi:leader peptidase (prepilin peptidase)/N-methyltransferase